MGLLLFVTPFALFLHVLAFFVFAVSYASTPVVAATAVFLCISLFVLWARTPVAVFLRWGGVVYPAVILASVATLACFVDDPGLAFFRGWGTALSYFLLYVVVWSPSAVALTSFRRFAFLAICPLAPLFAALTATHVGGRALKRLSRTTWLNIQRRSVILLILWAFGFVLYQTIRVRMSTRGLSWLMTLPVVYMFGSAAYMWIRDWKRFPTAIAAFSKDPTGERLRDFLSGFNTGRYRVAFVSSVRVEGRIPATPANLDVTHQLLQQAESNLRGWQRLTTARARWHYMIDIQIFGVLAPNSRERYVDQLCLLLEQLEQRKTLGEARAAREMGSEVEE